MADQLRWQPIPDIAPRHPSRTQQKFVDVYAPGKTPGFLAPLEEVTHDNYRILTFESRYCVFCSRLFEHPTALRKHLSEGTVPCKRAQQSARNGGPRFVFFCWKCSHGNVDPNVRRPTMHSKYARLEDLKKLNHALRDTWLSKVIPETIPGTPRSQQPGRPSQVVAAVSPANDVLKHNSPGIQREDQTDGAEQVEPSTSVLAPMDFGHRTRADGGRQGRQQLTLPHLGKAFVNLADRGRVLPLQKQGQITSLRRDRNYFKHFLIEEAEAIRMVNRDYYNEPLHPINRASQSRERPPHVSSLASPVVNPKFADPNDLHSLHYEWYTTSALQGARYLDASPSPTNIASSYPFSPVSRLTPFESHFSTVELAPSPISEAPPAQSSPYHSSADQVPRASMSFVPIMGPPAFDYGIDGRSYGYSADTLQSPNNFTANMMTPQF